MLPEIRFGSSPVTARKESSGSTDADDELLDETPADVIALLGFDPLELERAARASDAEYPGGTVQAALAAKGIETVIETHKGQQRRFANFRGINVPFDYGYIVGTSGADGDEVDCYIGPALSAPFAYVVDQNKVGSLSEYDECKVFLGFTTIQQAKAAYLAGHTHSAAIFRDITQMTLDELKSWLAKGQVTKPVRARDLVSCSACDSGDCLQHRPVRGSDALVEVTPDSKGTKEDVASLMERRSFGTGLKGYNFQVYYRHDGDTQLTVRFKDGLVKDVTCVRAGNDGDGVETRKGWSGLWSFAQAYGD